MKGKKEEMKGSIKFVTPKICLFGIRIILGCSLWEKKKNLKKEAAAAADGRESLKAK